MHKRGICCLSDRMSVTLMYGIEAAKDVIKLFNRPGNPIAKVY